MPSAELWMEPWVPLNSVFCDCYLDFNIEPRKEAGKQGLDHLPVPSPSVVSALVCCKFTMVLLALSSL